MTLLRFLNRLGAPNGVQFTERPQDGMIRGSILAQQPLLFHILKLTQSYFLNRLGAPNGVQFTERPQDGMIREDILAQQPPTLRASRLWDGNASSDAMPNGGDAYDDAARPQLNGRSRLDLDYSDGEWDYMLYLGPHCIIPPCRAYVIS